MARSSAFPAIPLHQPREAIASGTIPPDHPRGAPGRWHPAHSGARSRQGTDAEASAHTSQDSLQVARLGPGFPTFPTPSRFPTDHKPPGRTPRPRRIPPRAIRGSHGQPDGGPEIAAAVEPERGEGPWNPPHRTRQPAVGLRRGLRSGPTRHVERFRAAHPSTRKLGIDGA